MKVSVIKGMERIKSHRPSRINKIEKQFADDIKHGKDPTANMQKEPEAMESSHVQLEDLELRLTLAKNHEYIQKIDRKELLPVNYMLDKVTQSNITNLILQEAVLQILNY